MNNLSVSKNKYRHIFKFQIKVSSLPVTPREAAWDGPRSRSHPSTHRSLPADIMLQFLLGFNLGNVVGMYLAQNYAIPNLAKKLEDIKKDLDAKKKPPSS